jgi:glycosyltransferase involved in cell wall biosynthesis
MSRKLVLKSHGIDEKSPGRPGFSKSLQNLRVAVVHDWLVADGGAERVLEQILTLFPDADLYTLCDFFPAEKRSRIRQKKTVTSFLQKFPWAKKKYRSYLPFMPMAIEQFDLTAYDLVLSSSHAVAHGVLTNSDQLHISYFNNTMVYAWDLYHHYLKSAGLHKGLRGLLAKVILHYIRTWDASTANRVDRYVANSDYMAQRIAKLYGHRADVIYPPVDVDQFELHQEKEDFYVTVSRLVPFKRIDVIVDAFTRMPDKKVVIIGDGPEMKRLKAAAGPNVQFVGFQDRAVVKDYIKRARAFLFSSVEPFGIAMVEAQACGTPVIAYGKGAAQEIVADGESGVFFHQQTPEALIEAIRRFERIRDWFEPVQIRASAMRFSAERFRQEFFRLVETAVNAKFHREPRADDRLSPSEVEEFFPSLVS